MTGTNNICIGKRAGDHITDQSYQFCFTTQVYNPKVGRRLSEFRTTMSLEEWEVIDAVVTRAVKNGAYRKE